MPPKKDKTEQPPPAGDDEQATIAVTEPGQAPGESSAVIEPEPGALEEAVEDLGEAIRRNEGATGGYELGEEAHRSAIDRMAALGDGLELDEASLVARVRDFILEIIKARPKPWSATSPAEQRDVAAACDQLSEGLIREIVEVVRSGGKAAVRVLLTKVTLGDDTQIVGKLKALAPEEEDEAVMMLHHARGKHVLLTVASVDDYKQEHRAARTDVEEPPLPFEAGDHPSDDSDLVDAAEAPPEEAPLPERIDLKTGWVQRQVPGAIDNEGENAWEDVREATPEELAAERERVADFDTEPA